MPFLLSRLQEGTLVEQSTQASTILLAPQEADGLSVAVAASQVGVRGSPQQLFRLSPQQWEAQRQAQSQIVVAQPASPQQTMGRQQEDELLPLTVDAEWLGQQFPEDQLAGLKSSWRTATLGTWHPLLVTACVKRQTALHGDNLARMPPGETMLASARAMAEQVPLVCPLLWVLAKLWAAIRGTTAESYGDSPLGRICPVAAGISHEDWLDAIWASLTHTSAQINLVCRACDGVGHRNGGCEQSKLKPVEKMFQAKTGVRLSQVRARPGDLKALKELLPNTYADLAPLAKDGHMGCREPLPSNRLPQQLKGLSSALHKALASENATRPSHGTGKPGHRSWCPNWWWAPRRWPTSQHLRVWRRLEAELNEEIRA